MEFDITTRGKVSGRPERAGPQRPALGAHRRHRQRPLRPRHPPVWDDDEQRLVPDDLRVTRRPDGIPVRAADLGRIKIGQLIEPNLTR